MPISCRFSFTFGRYVKLIVQSFKLHGLLAWMEWLPEDNCFLWHLIFSFQVLENDYSFNIIPQIIVYMFGVAVATFISKFMWLSIIKPDRPDSSYVLCVAWWEHSLWFFRCVYILVHVSHTYGMLASRIYSYSLEQNSTLVSSYKSCILSFYTSAIRQAELTRQTWFSQTWQVKSHG